MSHPRHPSGDLTPASLVDSEDLGDETKIDRPAAVPNLGDSEERDAVDLTQSSPGPLLSHPAEDEDSAVTHPPRASTATEDENAHLRAALEGIADAPEDLDSASLREMARAALLGGSGT